MIAYRNILETDPQIQEQVRLWRNSPRVKSGMIDQTNISAKQHRHWLRLLASGPDKNAVKVAFWNSVPFGIINLKGIDRNVSSCDWGIYIGEEAFLGRGLGRRLAYDVHSWALEDESLGKMFSSVREDNLKILQTYLQLGDHVEGFLKKHLRSASGELIGLYLIAQFREEWLLNRERSAAWVRTGD